MHDVIQTDEKSIILAIIFKFYLFDHQDIEVIVSVATPGQTEMATIQVLQQVSRD